ncbi:restriction endonuclease [Actinoplanes sp. KI2]|uniref:restriction endonuclease n=1 Tax=Actinoplanes sp. KI2 TaxID=2983315 RepID=UPI0021D61599|nr:restriction endonuclease [Actinoplanes sp. KI2]MCU7730921.1 restriction endonuclease [Actinoplanes sp. KI2]
MVDGYPNFYFLATAPGSSLPMLTMERGITTPAGVKGPDGLRRPVILIRSSPWKAGHETNPWHDEFDVDHGHVRYFGDHKAGTTGLPGATPGNRGLLEAWRYHAGTSPAERLLAPPLILFRSTTVHRDGRAIVKGHVEFMGAALIERLEHVVQRDPQTGVTFPNIALDLAVVDLSDSGDELDMRWIYDRRDAALDAEKANRYAPESWKKWIKQGSAAVPSVRRRVLSSRIRSTAEQQPQAGSPEAEVLGKLYKFFDGRKHQFEQLAAVVAARVLGSSGASYSPGWLTRAGGDGGLDFVGRLDVGLPSANTPLVVLGQAKCVLPDSTVSAETVARVVARLRRGWLGVFVTTGSFSKSAQLEVIDDQYPLVLIAGLVLAEQVIAIAAADYAGDLDALLGAVEQDYEQAVTQRRPEEILRD